MSEKWPRLSQDLKYADSPVVCKNCGARLENAPADELGFTGPGKLQRWQECDGQDRPEPVLVILCPDCSRLLIGPHPRLYKAVQW